MKTRLRNTWSPIKILLPHFEAEAGRKLPSLSLSLLLLHVGEGGTAERELQW